MKKIIVLVIVLLTITGCTNNKQTGNYSSDMKIAYATDLSKEDGADSVERQGDHKDSKYFNQLDFYNMESTDTLTMVSNFKTMQQTSEWSCGVTSALMVLEHYGKLGDYNEESLATFRENDLNPEATTLQGVINIFEGVGGFKIESTYDYNEETKYEEITLDMIKAYLKKDVPVIVAWNDWGGHWQVIIGYDDMGSETTQDDVIIVADSYDTTDHNQDGYGIYPAERFYYNWTMYDFFEDAFGSTERDLLFIAAKPEK